MFQRHAFGFWNQPERDANKCHVQHRIEPERSRCTNRVQQRQEGRADDHVRYPVGGRGTGDAKVAAFERLNFGAQDPHHRRGAHRVACDTHHGHPDRKPGESAGSRAVIKLHQAVAEDQRAERHHAEANFQRRFAARLVHGEYGNKGGKHEGQPDHQGGDHLLFGGGEPRHFENARRVVHDDVHAGELLHRLQQHAEEDRPAHVAVDFKQCPAPLLELQAFADLIQLLAGFFRGIAQHAQHLFRLHVAPFLRQPARAVRQENH